MAMPTMGPEKEVTVTSWALSWGSRGSKSVRRQRRKLSSRTAGLELISIRLCWVHASRPTRATRTFKGWKNVSSKRAASSVRFSSCWKSGYFLTSELSATITNSTIFVSVTTSRLSL